MCDVKISNLIIMNKILLIITVLFLLIFTILQNKNILTENFLNNKYAQTIFPGQTLMDLDSTFNIDYNFDWIKKTSITIDNDQDYNLDSKYISKFSYLDNLSNDNENEIKYNPINASKVYEKKIND
jgi:hypothetical protein